MALKVTVKKGSIAQHKDEMIVVNLLEGVKKPGGATRAVDDELGGLITRMIKAGDITGTYRETVVLPGTGTGSPRVLVLGLGPKDKLDAEVEILDGSIMGIEEPSAVTKTCRYCEFACPVAQ